jgi:SAM-dependent methyltransferase
MTNIIFKKDFKLEDGIIKFKNFNDTTKKIQEFYKNDPFPNYREDDTKQTILNIGDNNLVAKQIKNFFQFNNKILEVGSGTSQLSSYLAIGTNNQIFAMDPTIESLNLAKNFSEKNNIKNINFVNADLFDDVYVDEVFDLVWCSGVLHHTNEPYLGFKNILKTLKKKGYIIIGLYNSIFRVKTIIRRAIFKLFGKKIILKIDPYLRSIKNDSKKINAWIHDQYEHPVESTHNFEEVLNWFTENNVEFISSIPSSESEKNSIFEKQKIGDKISRFLVQFFAIFSPLGNEGGLFLFIGKKK